MTFLATATDMLNTCIHFFGHGLCHQMAERSYHFGGVSWAVCARCSGIYVGLIFALFALLIAYRGAQRHGLMLRWYWVFLAAGVAFLGWDGVTSYMHLRETTNLLRWITGIGMGASLAPLIYFLLINNIAKRSIDEPVMGGGVWLRGFVELFRVNPRTAVTTLLSNPWIAIAISMLAAFLLVYPAGPLLGAAGAVIAALAIWATYGALALVILGILRPFYRSVETWRNLLLPGLLAAIIGLAVILGIALLYTRIL